MPLFAEKEDKIFGDILFDIVENTNITRTSPGSKTRAIAQALSKKLGRMWNQFDINMVQSFITGAEGKYLDYIGNLMGVERIGENTAKIASTDKILKFYTDIGTFGNINSNNSISIPAGTVISTQEGGVGIRYFLPYGVILPSGSSEFWVTAESVLPGTKYNVGSKTLVFHDFTNYTDVLNNSLKITNEIEIATARSVESDSNYRFRIANQTLAAAKANETAVRMAALVIPGVADVILTPYANGIGTFDLLIKSTSPTVPDGVILAVQAAMRNIVAMGIVPTVRKPREIGVAITGTLIFRKKISETDQQSIIAAVTDNVINYINNLDIGEELIVNEIIERVMATSDLIKNIGSANKPFDSIHLYKPSKLEDNRMRTTALGDYSPEADEKLFVENMYAGTTPILFRASL